MSRPALLRIICLVALAAALPHAAQAQRALNWNDFDVVAHLAANGDLRVVETQTIAFTGDWNGGERRFRIHPRQKLSFEGIYREGSGGWQKLTEDSRLTDVDDYAWIDATTLRWRSRRRADPPFANTVIRYELRYVLSGVLLKQADGYRLDHDFAFPDRDGRIDRFTLRFTFDPEWHPASEVRELYTAGPLPPGRSFILRLDLRHTGAALPNTLDLSRPPGIIIAVSVLLGLTALAMWWFFAHERSHGRFAMLPIDRVDEPWLKEHVLKYPAEVVGAAWDQSVGPTEVVALIARLVSEGKLASQLAVGDADRPSMTLHLKADRSTLQGYERTLVERLFFDQRTETSTELVKEHYSDEGFDPVHEIKPELEASVQELVPPGDSPRAFRIETLILFIAGIGAFLVAWSLGTFQPTRALLPGLGALVVAALGWVFGATFRSEMLWGRRAALYGLLPALILSSVTAAFLWFYAGVGTVELSTATLVGIVAVILALINSTINALRSRQSSEAIVLRKGFATGRQFFISELRKDRPALRDEWYPWAIALGLAGQVDDWSARRPVDDTADWSGRTPAASGTTDNTVSAPAPEQPWSGFGGGRSGGAGGGGSWAAAAGGMAAGVSAPRISSGGSSDSGSTWSSGGDSDGGGSSGGGSSSGGGGGGGW